MSPQRIDIEVDVLIFHNFYIKPNGGNGGDNLSKLELVQNHGLTHTHLFLGEESTG